VSVATSVGIGLARLLSDGSVARHSGIATAVRGKLKRLFCLDKGRLVFAASNVIEEQFSELLVREKLLTVDGLAAARTASENTGVKLTRLLLDEQLIERPALDGVLEQHVRQLLFSTLDWPDGEASLARGNPDLGREVTTDLDCVALLLEYTEGHPASLQELKNRMGQASSRLQVTADRLSILDGFDSHPAVRHLVESCDGTKSMGDVVRTSPEADEPTWRALYGLLLTGVLAPVAAVGPELQLDREKVLSRLELAELSDYYRLLRVNTGSSRDDILRAYYVVAREYHPDRFRTGPLQDLRERIEIYFGQVTDAYNTLHDDELRAAYDRERAEDHEEATHDTRELAAENFKRAASLIARGRFADAVPWMKNAIQQDDRNASYRLELGKLLARNPRLRQEAEQHLIEANRLDPALVEGYLALGDLYLKKADRENSAKMFREVLRWDPGHLEAEVRLKKLG